jgi:hypothetical protein
MEARNRVGIGLSYRPARLHRLAEFIPWNRFLGSINVQKYGLFTQYKTISALSMADSLARALQKPPQADLDINVKYKYL